MKLRRAVIVTAITSTLCLAPMSARAQSTRTFTEWVISTSSNCPFNVFPISSSVIYFTESGCNGNIGQIGRLNATTDTVTEWTGSVLIGPGGLIAIGGSVLFTDAGANTINMFNPKTNSLKSWGVPFSGPLNLVAVGTRIFFTELNANKIGMLDLLTNNLTEWTISGGLGGPLGIAATDDGSGIWFSALSAPQLGVLRPDDSTFQQWTLPASVQGHHVQHVALAEEDHVFFVDDFSGTVGQLDPSTSVVTLWAPPSPAVPVDLQVRESDGGRSEEQQAFRVDFADSANKIGRLLTASQSGITAIASTTTTTATVTVTSLTPSTSVLTATSTVVAPTITNVAGVVTGGFEEWLVPTGNSDTYGIAELSRGGVAFTEANGNKIATLR